MDRLKQIQDFTNSIIGKYPMLTHGIQLNNEEEDVSDFEVTITNSTNEKRSVIVLRCHDYLGGIDILKGDEFYSTDELDFAMTLFLDLFLTFREI